MKKSFIVLALLAATHLGCKLEEININPNVPGDVPLETLLPPASTAMAETYGGRVFRYSNIFTNHMEGTSNQELQTDRYNVDEGFVGRIWEGLYGQAMINLKLIIDKSTDEDSPHYRGIAKIMMANCLGTMTSMFGDVPYSQALNVAEFPNPIYDSQEQLYTSIQQLLSEGIQDLDAGESVFSPGADDLIYSGDLSKWKKAAYMLKARYRLHLVKINGGDPSDAIFDLQFAFESTSDDLTYEPLGISADLNPIYAFFEDSPYMIIDPAFDALIGSLDDPRADYLFDVIPFTGGQKKPGEYFAGPMARVPFASYIEQLFLLAECHLRLQDVPSAQSALEDAVELSCNEISLGAIDQSEIDSYLDEAATLSGNFEDDLEVIMLQKYIALFTQLEPWTDFRRTGYPELTPNDPGVSGVNPNGEIPRRLMYPQSERLYNTSVPMPIPTMQDRFWWDQ